MKPAARSGLLERAALLAELDTLLAEGGRMVFVGGEAGVGKTALVRAFTEAAKAPALVGSCENLGAAAPLGPFADIAARTGGRVADSLATGGEPRGVAMALLGRLADRAIVVLEDVHWADQATLDALRVIGRRIDATPSLVLATYRDDEVTGDHPLRVVLGELASTRAVSRLSVPPLSLEAVHELAEPHGADADGIHRLTKGNAFFVTEILAAGSQQLPETVRDAVLARAARLDADARRLLEVVSVIPARAELWLLEAVAPDEIEQSRHASPRGSCAGRGRGLVPARARQARGRERGRAAPPPRAARGGPARAGGDRRPLPAGLPRRGGRRLGGGAGARAGGRAARAGGVGPPGSRGPVRARAASRSGLDPAEHAGLLSAYGDEARLIGGFPEAIRAYLEAIRLYHELGDVLREGDVWGRLAQPYVNAGSERRRRGGERARHRAARARAGRAGADPRLLTQAYLRMLNRDNADGVAWGERALAAAERLCDEEGSIYALTMIGASHMMAGGIDLGVEYLLRSLERARLVKSDFWINSALRMLGSGLGEMYEPKRRRPELEQQIAYGEDRDLQVSYAQAWLACVHAYRGRWDDATALARTVLVSAPGDTIGRITALIALGACAGGAAIRAGRTALDEALELARPGDTCSDSATCTPRVRRRPGRRATASERSRKHAPCIRSRSRSGTVVCRRARLLAVEGGRAREAPDWIAQPFRLQIEGDARGACEAWRARGCPYEAARALTEASDEASLLEALAEFDRLVQRSGRAGSCDGGSVLRGPREATREHPAGLTRREHEVLELVAWACRIARSRDGSCSRRGPSTTTSRRFCASSTRARAAEAVTRFREISVAAAPNMGDNADAVARSGP